MLKNQGLVRPGVDGFLSSIAKLKSNDYALSIRPDPIVPGDKTMIADRGWSYCLSALRYGNSSPYRVVRTRTVSINLLRDVG